MTERTFIDEIEDKYDLESELEIYFQFFTDNYCKEDEDLLRKVYKKYWKFKLKDSKNERLIMQSKCTECGIKKSRFVREQKAKGLLSN